MGRAIIVPDVDFSQSGLGTVTINGVVPVLGLKIKGPASVDDEAYFSVSYYPLSTTQKGVTWSVIEGGTYATIDSSTGLLSVVAGSDADSDAVKIKATSVVDSNVFAVFDTLVTETGSFPLPVEGRRLQGFDDAYLNATKYYSGSKVFPYEDTTFFIDFIFPSNRDYARSVYGGMIANDNNGQWIHGVVLAGSATGANKLAFRIDDYNKSSESSSKPLFTNSTRKRIKYTRTGRNYTVDIDGVVSTGVVGTGVLINALEIYLFAGYNNNGGTITAVNISDGLQIYSAKMTKNGDDVFDVYPAEWNGVVGMWDRVSKQLIGPEASGYFSLVDNS